MAYRPFGRVRRASHSYRARLCDGLSTRDPGRTCRDCPDAGVGMDAPPDCPDFGTSAKHHQSGGATQHRSVGRVRRLLGPCRCAAPSSADPADGAPGASPLAAYVRAKLLERWSPEQIAHRLPLDFSDASTMRISHQTLYHWIATDRAAGGVWYRCLRQHRRRHRKRYGSGPRASRLKGRVSLTERPAVVARRADGSETGKGIPWWDGAARPPSRRTWNGKVASCSPQPSRDGQRPPSTRRPAACSASSPRRCARHSPSRTAVNGWHFKTCNEPCPSACILRRPMPHGSEAPMRTRTDCCAIISRTPTDSPAFEHRSLPKWSGPSIIDLANASPIGRRRKCSSLALVVHFGFEFTRW